MFLRTMRLKFCLLFACILAAAFVVQSETTIEVDDNGDEYEVKRFNIEGRQLEGGRSQCVVTRRKRSSAAAPVVDEAVVNESNDNTNRKRKDSVTASTTPASGVDTNTDVEDEGDYAENSDGDEEINHIENHENNNMEAEEAEGEGDGGDAQNGDAQNVDDYDYDEDEQQENQQNVQFPIIVQKQGEKEQAAQTDAGHTENAEQPANGIVVVQGNKPPQVNPETHAVFQLLPVNHAINAAIDYNADNGILHFEEDISPISTTAIWSTGDDTPKDDYDDDYDYDSALSGDKKKKKKKKGSSSSSSSSSKDKKKKKKKKSSKKGSKKKGSKNKYSSHKNKNKNKKKRPSNSSMNKHRRPGNKNRRPITGNRRKGSNVVYYPHRRYRPQRVQNNINSVRRKNNKNNNSNSSNNRRSHSNRNNRNTNRRRKNNLDVVDKGTRTYTKTETMTQTGTANDNNKDLNCIIIRKDPPPTQRPFWNILGRNAEDDSTNVGRTSHFGKRKRANLRFTAKKEN